MASDPVSGHFYVGDSGNARISEFTVWGEFVKAWGWGVVASGPGNEPQNEEQQIRVDATSGSFRLRYIIGNEQETAPIAFNASAEAVQTAYEAMPEVAPGDVAVSGPTGGPWTVEFTGNLADTDIRLPQVVASSLAGGGAVATVHTLQGGGGYEVCVADDGDLCRAGQALASVDGTVDQRGQLVDATALAVDPARDIYVFEGSAQRVSKFDPSGEFLLAFGGDVVATGPSDSAVDEQQKVTVKATGGSFRLRFEDPFPGDISQETALLPFNASAAQVDAALEALPAIGDSGASVTVSGGPGDATGSSPYLIDFEGSLGGDDVPTLQASNLLTGPEASISVQTTVPGGAPEICKAAVGDSCKRGSVGTANGQFQASSFETNLAAGSSGTIYVGDKDRIQAFNPDGSFKAQLPLPEAGTVGSLAADPNSGDLYLTYSGGSKPNVRRLDETTGAEISSLAVEKPGPIAVDSKGNVYVLVDPPELGAGGEPKVLTFGPAAGPCVICAADNFAEAPAKPPPGRIGINGLATNSGCEVASDHLYASYFNGVPGVAVSFVRAFGPQPEDVVTCPPPEVPPTIEAQYAISVDSDDATVQAEINPNFWPDTRYYVEYGTGKCSEGGCPNTQPLPPGPLLTDKVTKAPLKTAGVFLANLTSNTTYRYRFVAQSSGGGPAFGIDPDGAGPQEASFEEGLEASLTTFPPAPALKTDCPNQAFRTGPSAFLPDCRAFELVSPVDKGGADITVSPGVNAYPAELLQASVDGEKLTYSADKAFADAVGASFTSQYIATRIPEVEWSTHSISPPRGPDVVNHSLFRFDVSFKAFSEDLCQSWLRHDTDPPLAPGALEGAFNLYRRQNCGAEGYEAVTTPELPSLTFLPDFEPELQGFSADGSHAVFRANEKLTEDAPGIKDLQLYENFEGDLRYVCVLPGGAASGEPCSAGTANTSFAEGRTNTVARAVSTNGSRIYWTGAVFGPAPLYVRIDGNETIAVSGTVSGADARFWTASPDGSKAIFAIEDSLSPLDDNLYEFDLASETSQLIAEDVRGVMGANEDASRLYLVSTQALDAGASAGKPNLYLYEAGEPPTYTFVATLSAKDAINAEATISSLNQIPTRRTSRISPDGQFVAFMSQAPLTGYDNTDVNSGEADAEVFLYSAPSEELVCVSCNPSGARPAGRDIKEETNLQNSFWAAAQIPGWPSQFHASRVFAEDGSRLFFESFEALVPRDSNGKQDVYEWSRASGQAACTAIGAELFVAASGGCLSLISSGQSGQDSEFVDASPEGDDVFFKTGSSLLPQDPGLIDIYDARVEGGLPIPVEDEEDCQGEACQSPSAPPQDPTPSSSSYVGPGSIDQKPKKCPKGKRKAKVKGKVRCIAKKRKGKAANKANRSGRAR